jgi:hypothetical protein
MAKGWIAVVFGVAVGDLTFQGSATGGAQYKDPLEPLSLMTFSIQWDGLRL